MKRRDEVSVGIMITVAVVVLLTGVLWLARGGLSSGYPLYTRFAWGQNLKQGQPVLLAGVNIGYVDDVELRPDGYLDVVMRVNNRYHVPKTAKATVRAVGFFGDVAVALTPKLGANLTDTFAAGDTVPAGPPEAGVAEIMSKADSISGALSQITHSLQVQVVDAGGLRDLRKTIASTSALAVQLQHIATEQNENLTRTLEAYRQRGPVDRHGASGLHGEELPGVEPVRVEHGGEARHGGVAAQRPARQGQQRPRLAGTPAERQHALSEFPQLAGERRFPARGHQGASGAVHQRAHLLNRSAVRSRPSQVERRTTACRVLRTADCWFEVDPPVPARDLSRADLPLSETRTVMRLLLGEAIFWIAAVCCLVAQVAIIRSAFRPHEPVAGSALVPRPRTAVEVVWTLLPALVLIGVFMLTWRAMHQPTVPTAFRLSDSVVAPKALP